MNSTNNFLLTIGKQARQNRERFWDKNEFSIRLSQFKGQPEAGLWFRTQGCSYDHRGGCLMCDYSTGRHTDANEMIKYVENGLKQIPISCSQLLVSPSGSMLDEKEVPKTALTGILAALSKTTHKLFSFETRADTITEEKIDICQSFLGERFYRLFVGLECANDWILKYCINKQLRADDFSRTVELLKRKNVKVAANVLISVPFLTEAENIEIAIESAKWAFSLGADECFLFPVHVKRSTPLSVLYEKQLFSPPSLWSLVEIIHRLGPSYYDRIRLSWYTSYGAYNILASPYTCYNCYDETIDHLDQFAEYQLASEINYLYNMKCECKEKWRDQLECDLRSAISLPLRVKNGYKIFTERFLESDWWSQNAEKLFTDIDSEADRFLYSGIGGQHIQRGI